MSYEDIRRQLRASVGEDKGEDARMRYARQDQQRRQQEQQQQQASAFDNYLKQLDDKVTSTTSAYEEYKKKLDSLPAFDDPYAGYAVDPVTVANMSTGGSKKDKDEMARLYKEMTEAKNAQQEARNYQNYTTRLKSFGGDSEKMFQDYADRIKEIEATYRTQPDKWREIRKQVKALEQERDSLKDYEDSLKKSQANAAVLDAWAKGNGGTYASYQLAQKNYDELDRRVTQLQNELMVSGGAEQDYSGWATDEMSAAAIANRPTAKGNSKELQTQLEQAIREREQAKMILQYAQAHQADELNKAPDFELKAASGEEKFKAFKQEQQQELNTIETNPFAPSTVSRYDPTYHSDYREPDERWSEEEKKNFYYLYADEATRQQAYDYGISIDQKYNRGEAEARDWSTREFATRNFGTGAMASAASVPANLIGGAIDYGRMFAENAARGGIYETQYDGWSRWADTTRGAIAEKLNESGTISRDVPVLGGKGLGDLYQLMMSMADSSVAVMAGGGAANAVFFGSAAASTTRQALERGISGNRAVAMGFASGIAEVAGETLSVEHLLKQGDIADYLRHGLLREMAKQGGVEASEEVLTSILNMMADAVINGDESELQQKVYVNVANGMAYDEAVRQASKEWLEELGTDALGGFLSGGLMSGGRLALQSGVAAVTKYQGDAKGDLELARLTTEGSRSRSLADQYQQRLDKKGSITNLQAARLQAQTSADISAADRPALLRAAEERLRDQSTSRMTSGEYKRMAQDIVDGVLDGRTSKFSTALEQNVYEEMRMQIAGETVRTGNWLDDAGLKLTEARNAATKRLKMVETKDGEKVEVKNATMKDGELQLTIEQDGETKPVDLKDLKLDQYQMRALKTLTDTLGDDAAAAYNMMSGTGLQYGRASSIASYATAFGIIRDTFGRSADTEKAEAAALASSLRKGLTDEQVRYAVAIGQKRAKENGTLITRDKSVWGTGKVTMDGGTLNDGTVLKGVKNKAKVLRSRQYAAVKAVAKALGIDVVLFESEADKDGNLAGAQGAYQDGVIYLDWNAGMNNIKATSERMLLRTMSHELTHFLQQNAPEDYEKLKNYVTAYLAEKMGENYRRLVMEKMANQPGLSYDGAIDEVVADSCETMLRDSQYVQEMIRKDRSFGQKIWDWIKSFFRKIEASDTGAKYMQATIDELRDIWDSAMKNAVESRPDVDTSSKKAAEGGRAQMSTRRIVGADGTDYGIGVVLDTNIFNGVSPRNWGPILGNYVYTNLDGARLTMYDDDGKPETVYTARASDVVKKIGAKREHPALSDLAFASGNNVKALVTVHLDEALKASDPNEDVTSENTHGWLDEYGWIKRHVIVQTVTGGIYDAELNIANGRRGLIAYKVGKIRRLGDASVTSNGKPAGTKRNSKPSGGNVSRPGEKNKPKSQFSLRDRQHNNWAPTFYSKMQNVITDWTNGKGQPLPQKMSAQQVVGWLKGKGVKAEEIRWSGIVPWMEGRKTVTRDELLQVMAENQINIETKVLGRRVTKEGYYQVNLPDGGTRKLDDVDAVFNYSDELAVQSGYEKGDFEVLPSAFGGNVRIWNNKENSLVTYASYIEPEIEDDTKWSGYATHGGSGYREILFKMPSLGGYTNDAMQIHWGEKDVVAHARVQDMTGSGGRSVLYIEEIQSDLHNAGAKAGFATKDHIELQGLARKYHYDSTTMPAEDKARYDKLRSKLIPLESEYIAKKHQKRLAERETHKTIKAILNRFRERLDAEEGIDYFLRRIFYNYIDESGVAKWIRGDSPGPIDDREADIEIQKDAEAELRKDITAEEQKVLDAYRDICKEVDELREEYANQHSQAMKATSPEVPFSGSADTYHEYVMKHLLRMAAEGDYDTIAWTTADLQSERWSDEYAEGYRIEYDQSIPKFMRKYVKQWGATVGTTRLNGDGAEVWSVDLTNAMKKSVLTEGQPLFSTRGEAQKWDGVEEQAAEHFGTTENFRTAGYILQDGRMLDFSGAHWLDGYDEKYIADWKKKNDIRQVDHEDVYEAFEAMDEANAPSDSSLTFINRGNIRIVPEVPGIELSANAEPTAAQYQQIRNFVRETVFDSRHYNSDRFTVDLAITRSKRAGALRYTGKVSPDRVVNDIKHYFQTGEIREQGLGAFYSMRSSTKTDREILESVGSQQIMAERLEQEKEILQGSVNELQRMLGRRDSTIEKLRRQLRLTKTPELRTNDAKRMARDLLRDYDSRADAEKIAEEIKALGEFVLGTELTGRAYDDELDQRARAIAREIVENARASVTEGTDVYREIARRIKGTKLSIDESMMGDLGDFDVFRKSLFGKLTIAKRKTNTRESRDGYASTDKVYAELQSDYGETIFPDALNEGDQLLNIARVFDLSAPQEANPFADDMDAAEESVRGRVLLDLYSGALRLEAPTAADRAKSRREALQQQIKELQRQNKLSAKESERLAETVYDLSLNLDQAQSRYRTLAEQSKKKLDELQKYKDLNDRYREKEREVNAALQELDRLVQHSGSREEIQRQRAKVSAKEEQMAKALERLTQAKGGSEIQEILRKEREIQMQRTQDRIRDSIDRRDLRQRISKLWKDLNARVTNPSEKKRIPVELMQQTLDVLEALNMDTSREDSKAGEKLRAKLDSLQARYRELQNDPDFRKAAVYDAQVAEYLTNMIAQVGDTPINKMSVAQMETVLETLKAMVYTANRAMKLKLGEQELEAYEVSKAMTKEARSVEKPKTGFLSTWLNAQLSPERMFNRLGGYSKDSYWGKVYGMLNEGQLKQTRLQMEGSLIFEDLMEKENEKNFQKLLDPKNTVDIGLKDENGEPVLITHGMMISLYMHLQNDQNIRHIAYGGLTIPALQDYYNGKKVRGNERATRVGGALQEIAEINDRLHETEDADEIAELEQERDEAALRAMDFVEGLREEIDKQLTDYDRQWIAASKELFDGFSKRELNRTTLEVYGIKRANVENYFPIWVDGDFLNTPFETVAKDLSLENAGFMKERVDSSKPIRLADVTDVTSSQIRKVAQYCGLMPAIRGFNKVWGKTQTGYRDSLQKAVHETFGQAGVKYVENLMADLNGARGGQDSALGEFLNRMRGHMAQASLTMSLRVAMGQTASYPTAAAVVGWGPLMKALAHGGKGNTIISRADQELIRKWSPLLYYRMKGYSTTELGDIAGMNDKFSRLWKKARWLTGWIQAMDGLTVGRLWYAAEYYVQDHNKALVKGTDAYYEAVAKVFNDIVEKTQPDYTTMQRPDILRNPNALVKQLTMFLTQRLQNFNILYDAAATYSKYKADFKAGRNGVTTEDVRQAGIATRRAVISQLAAAATITAFKFLADIGLHSLKNYRDDDDELTMQSVSLELLDMFMDSLAGNVLGGGEVYDLIESKVFGKTYYGIEVSGLATVTDLVDAFSSAFDHALKGELSWKDADKLARNLATVAGIPYANAKKFVQAGIWYAADVRNGEWLWESNAGIDRSTSQQASRLYRAYTNGDGAKVKQILEEVPEDKKKDVYSAVRKLIREQQKSGELNVYEAMRQMKNYGGATDQIMAEYIKDLYEAGSLPKADAEKYLQEYAGKTKEAAAKTVTNVDGKQASGVNYNDIDDMFKLGTMNAEEARKALVGYGIAQDTATMKVEYWSYQQKNPGTAMTTEDRFETYWKKYRPVGMTPSMYDDFYAQWNAVQGTDKDHDGKADRNSKKYERIAIIDSLPLSREQKDALFNMEWKTGLQDAPWNK